jgi:dienelactone hydrolase
MRRLLLLAVASAALGALSVPGREACAKEKTPPPPAKTGTWEMPAKAPVKYVLMSVPKDYDASKYYPLAFVLHPMTDDPATSTPEPYVKVWTETLGSKGWILASPALPMYDNEESLGPILDSLKLVQTVYKIDDRRIVLVGHNAGALMAWRTWTRNPTLFAGIVALSGEIPSQDRTALKALAGKSVYIFRGGKDASYTDQMLEVDRKYLESFKITPTIEVKPDWDVAFPTPSAPTISTWIDGVWPPGAYRERADAVEKALAAKDLAATAGAIKELGVELKKSPYPAFQARLLGYAKALEEQGRALIEDAKKLVEADPLAALAQMETTAKSLKGTGALESEGAKALAAMRKDPKVVDALRKKEAEAQAASFMDKAAALEAKGDLAKALEAYRKAAALDSSRKEEAQKKVAELEPKVGGGG